MNLIYQIGRFDRGFNTPIKFKISDTIEKVLSSFALKEYLSSHTLTKVVIIYPVSLLLNSNSTSWDLPLVFKEKLIKLFESSEEKEQYLNNPKEYFQLHPHSQLADYFLVIHSIGEYEGVRLSATFDDLVLEIFFDMVSHFLEEPFSTLYLDISSGHNIYVSALLEAGRLFLAFYQLRNWVKDEKSLRVYIVFSDPIIGTPKGEYQLYTHYELKVRIFFSAPIVIRKDDYQFAKKLTKNNKYLKKKIQPYLEKAYFFYSIIKNNIPLCLYTFEPHNLKDIDSIIKTIIDFGKENFFKTYKKALNVDKDIFIKAIFLLALYYGIVKVLQKYEIYPKQEVSIHELNQKFCKQNSIYENFYLPLHRNYLGHEISNNFEKEKMKKKFQPVWKPFREFISEESTDTEVKSANQDIIPRNFIAHCGFERNCLEVKKINSEILLRYNKEKLEKIKKIIWKN